MYLCNVRLKMRQQNSVLPTAKSLSYINLNLSSVVGKFTLKDYQRHLVIFSIENY